ncbi:hypothetical protein E4U09_006199 [Claviceps aff. purpurea]|uniref:Uncharacterized protein n=1 Tax=Claviceps aff. purpurea TaxID=1967640 RepID=A0A9P7TW87_9HYPO|nr:hypothetical protein E4U09_006199 [Claviceps aff. purpurea]
MTLRIFNARAGINFYQSWARVIAYRDVSIASFGNNVQGAGAVGVGFQGSGLGRFKLVALHGDVEYNRILFVLEIGAQRPFNHCLMCSGWPAERALLPNTSTGMSVHEADTAQSWVRCFFQSRRDSGHVEGITSAEHAGSCLAIRGHWHLGSDVCAGDGNA